MPPKSNPKPKVKPATRPALSSYRPSNSRQEFSDAEDPDDLMDPSSDIGKRGPLPEHDENEDVDQSELPQVTKRSRGDRRPQSEQTDGRQRNKNTQDSQSTEQRPQLKGLNGQLRDNVWVLVLAIIILQSLQFSYFYRVTSALQEDVNNLRNKKVPTDGTSDTPNKLQSLEGRFKDYTPTNGLKAVIQQEINDKNFVLESDLSYKVDNKVAEKLNNIDEIEGFKTLQGTTEDLKVDLNGVNQSFTAFQNNVSSSNKTLNDAVGNLTSEVGENKRVTLKLQEEFPDVKDRLGNVEDAVKNVARDLESKEKELTRMIGETGDKLGQTLQTADEKVKRLNQDIKKLDDIQASVQMTVDKIFPNTFNKGSVTVAAVIIIFIVFGEVIAIYIICQHLPPRGGAVTVSRSDGNSSSTRRSLPSHEILLQVPDHPHLNAGICILSYDEDRQLTHRNMLLSCIQQPNKVLENIQSYAVHRHVDILNIPRRKLCFVFTEFSERHVIIEERGLGLGDLKRTTAEAILKMGCTLVIVYVHDPGSRRLRRDMLYNDDIDCVTSQEILKTLHKEKCFFSVYDQFSEFQKASVSGLIRQFG